MSARILGLFLIAIGLLSGCSLFDPNRDNPDAVQQAEDPYHTDPKYQSDAPGQGGFNPRTQEGKADAGLFSSLFGGDSKGSSGGGGPGIGVNSYLWRATLDTVSFMPLASADPFGGVIITDWYSPPDSKDERFKVNIFILGRELRADGVRASVFRQNRDQAGQWVDASVDQATGTDLENSILTRARQMRLSTAAAANK
jgi:Domain of unknown function (DUF3576)